MNHSENLRGMAEFPNDVTADYLLDMASSMQHYEERIAELESDNRRMRKVMQRYIDCQDNAKNNWVLDFLQVLEKEK